MDQSSLESVALIGVIHGIGEVVERSTIALIDYIYYQVSPGENASSLGRFSYSSSWAACSRYRHYERGVRSKCCHLCKRLLVLVPILLRGGQSSTRAAALFCGHHLSSLGY